VTHIAVERRGATLELSVRANAFLHHMVRNIAGALIAVGAGRHPTDWVEELLTARDRRLGAATAPPQGLYLAQVEYPPAFGVPPAGMTDACPAGADV
jgi:tRNA pseudouridine38-40 synthase